MVHEVVHGHLQIGEYPDRGIQIGEADRGKCADRGIFPYLDARQGNIPLSGFPLSGRPDRGNIPLSGPDRGIFPYLDVQTGHS